MKRNFIFFIGLYFLLGLCSLSTHGQKATAFEIKGDTNENYRGKLYVTVNGKPRKIYDEATNAWLVNGGKEVAFAKEDRSRGFEAEGESLNVYNVKTGAIRGVMAEYNVITGLSEVKLTNGKTVFLVSLTDGGAGAAYFAVVDPQHGQIFKQNFAALAAIKGDQISLAFYDENQDWEAVGSEKDSINAKSRDALPRLTNIAPVKTQTLDLKTILKNKVIYNKTNEELAAEYESKYKDVVVYLWHPNETPPAGKNYFMMAVSKTLPARAKFAPLRPTLELLFAGADQTDEQSGFSSATFGMKFEGVILKNGTATVKFSQPPNERNYGSLAPFIFQEAVERTAKQFPTVKRVEICAVGETLIDSELEKRFPRCF